MGEALNLNSTIWADIVWVSGDITNAFLEFLAELLGGLLELKQFAL